MTPFPIFHEIGVVYWNDLHRIGIIAWLIALGLGLLGALAQWADDAPPVEKRLDDLERKVQEIQRRR